MGGWWHRCCGRRWCARRCSDGGPLQFEVEIALIAAGTCGNCLTFNDRFILDRHTVTDEANTWCRWSYSLGGAVCGIATVNLFAYEPTPVFPGDYATSVALYNIGPGGPLYFRKLHGAVKPACKTFNNLVIPLVWQDPLWTDCDASAATCKVTALL